MCAILNSRLNANAIGVLEDVILENQVQANETDGDQDGNIFETRPVPDHETPHARNVHRLPPELSCYWRQRRRPSQVSSSSRMSRNTTYVLFQAGCGCYFPGPDTILRESSTVQFASAKAILDIPFAILPMSRLKFAPKLVFIRVEIVRQGPQQGALRGSYMRCELTLGIKTEKLGQKASLARVQLDQNEWLGSIIFVAYLLMED
jgi:hypothetical protein